MKKGKYLITGCAGFIGSHVVHDLYKKYNLILVDDLSEGKLVNLPKALRGKLIKKKIQDIKNFKCGGLKGIIHLAAQSSVPISVKNFYTSSKNNLESSLRVFEIAHQYSVPVIYASSSAIYGNLPIGNDLKNNFSISSPYAQDKLSLENYAKMFFNVYNISSIGLRFFNVYGPNQRSDSPYSAVIPIFISRMKKNLPVIINGGYQTRDFVYIKDVIEVIKMSMKKIQLKKFNGVFNVGTGKSVKIDDLYKLIKSKIKNNSKIVRRPLDKYDPKKSAGRFKKLQKYLNFKKNSFTKLEEGITKTIAYKY